MKYIIGVIILVFFSLYNYFTKGIKNCKEIYDFKTIYETTLPIPDNVQKFDFEGCKLFISENDSILIVPFISSKRILIYSLNHKKLINNIDISCISFNNLSNVYCFNKDSFLLLYTYHGYSFEENLNDSLLYIITLKKNNNVSAYKLNLPKSKYFCIKKSEYNDSSFVYPSFNNNSLVIFNQNKLVIPYKRLSTHNIGEKKFVKIHMPVCGIMDIKNKKIKDANFFDFPYIKEGIYYPRDIKEKYYCSNDNHLFIRYFYSQDVFILDSNVQYIAKKKLKSLLVDSIYPFAEARFNHWGNKTINAIYLHLNYDKYRKLFYSYVYFPSQRYGKVFFSMIIADSALNYVNELINNIKLSYNSIYTDRYIISINTDRGKLNLKYYELDKKQITKEEYDNFIKLHVDSLKKMELQENNKICSIIPSISIESGKINKISDYILNVQKIKEPTFASIYLYTDMVCESCVHSVLFDFMLNAKNYEKLPIFLSLSGKSTTINKLLDKYYLKKYSKLYLDTNKIYNYFDPFNNATVRMVLSSKGKIISDTVYYPTGIDTMMNRCYHFFEKYLESNH